MQYITHYYLCPLLSPLPPHLAPQSTCIIQQPPNDTAIVCPSPATPTGTTTDTVTVSIQLDGLNVTSDIVNRTVTVYENPTFLPIGSTITQQQTNLQDISIEVNPAISESCDHESAV